jgi:hypothetical protein
MGKAVSNRAKQLMDEYVLLRVLSGLRTTKDRETVVEKARQLKCTGALSEFLEHPETIDPDAVALRRQEALDALTVGGRSRDDAYEVLFKHQNDLAVRLGVVINREGASLVRVGA